jgi:glucokinase
VKKFIIGIDLGGTNIKSAIFNTEFQTIIERSDPTEAALGPSHVLSNIKRVIKEILSELDIDQSVVKCMGMGIPGLLNPDEGLSIFSPNFSEWGNIHVVNEMRNAFTFPIFIDNDVRVNLCATLGERAGMVGAAAYANKRLSLK